MLNKLVVIPALLSLSVMSAGLAHAAPQQPPSTTPVPAKSVTPKAALTADQRYAVINTDGTIARNLGAVSAKKISTGTYEVIFNRNVTACSYTGTIGSATPTPATTGQISVSPRANNVNGVFIRTANSTGTNTDLGFHVAVLCD
ncbi:MAG: hypothetical protein WCD18_09930 [Thermosynechococcaceae cyanobacterium]